MFRYIVAAALGLACFCAVPASAQTAAAQPQPQPSRWHVDGGSERCVLTRELQGPAGAATFVLRTIPGSGRYDVILAGPGVTHSYGSHPGEEARLSMAAGNSYSAPAAAIRMPAPHGRGLLVGPLGADFTAAFRGGSALRLADGSGRALGSWTVPAAARAADALAYCVTEKQVEWGADRAALEAGATPARPAGDVADWITIRDFGLFDSTVSALFTVVFRIVVDERGAAADCAVIEVAGNVPEVQQRFCAVVRRRARYQPARDARGAPVRAIATHVLSFQLDTNFR